jgi:3-oxoadipate enol-lactonase
MPGESLEMSFAEINGLKMHYELAGEAGRPVLVFSNSLGASLAVWDAQAEALGGDFQILRYDTRGHGQSTAGESPLSVADLAHDVLGLLDSLNMQRVSFCGLSMGGSIGQWLGIHAPNRLDNLILANTAAKIGNAQTWNARIATVMQDGLRTVIPGTLERWFTAAFRAEHPETISFIRKMLEGTDVHGYAACCGAIRDADFRAELTNIATPTLVVAGSDDPVTTPADGQFLTSSIPGARYVELKAAHLSNLGAASEFNAELLKFLRD